MLTPNKFLQTSVTAVSAALLKQDARTDRENKLKELTQTSASK